MQQTKQKVRRFYAFKIMEGEFKNYITTKSKVKCFPDEEPVYVLKGYKTTEKCDKDISDFPKKGKVYSTITGVNFICTDFWLTPCSE